jgi:hypothetical protein
VATVAAERSPTAARGPETRPVPRLFDPGAPALEDVMLTAWEDLTMGRHTECPVCGGAMSMLEGCARCGSELS